MKQDKLVFLLYRSQNGPVCRLTLSTTNSMPPLSTSRFLASMNIVLLAPGTSVDLAPD
jgi:hypothetical protein